MEETQAQLLHVEKGNRGKKKKRQDKEGGEAGGNCHYFLKLNGKKHQRQNLEYDKLIARLSCRHL